MGAFFTNIQLRTIDLGQTELQEKVITFLIEYFFNQGFVWVDREEDVDKTVIVSQSGDFPWLAIYDEEFEGQSLRKQNSLSSELSKKFATNVLSVLVNDSDSLYVRLYEKGRIRDTLSNISKKTDFTENKPEVWSNLLTNKFTFKDIQNAWQNRSLFVENFLSEFAQYINIDSSKIMTGYEYLHQENPAEGIKLHFAQKVRKSVPDLGPTRFFMFARPSQIYIKCGENCTKGWMLFNLGASSKGIEILIGGVGTEQDILIPRTVRVRYFENTGIGKTEVEATFKETVSTTGEKIFYVRLEDIYVPPGIEPVPQLTPKEAKRQSKILDESLMRFDISFIGNKVGSGDVEIYFSPLLNRQAGTASSRIPGVITE